MWHVEDKRLDRFVFEVSDIPFFKTKRMPSGFLVNHLPLEIKKDETGGPAPLIYLIEDDSSVRDALVWSLRRVHAEIKTYSRPSELLDTSPSAVPGCLLVDFRLPEMDGLSLLKELRERGWRLPFIVISGCGDISVAVTAMRLGAIDFMEKPIDEHVICRLVEDAIESDRKRLALHNHHHKIAARLASLTKRESDVLEGVVVGRLNKQIAVDLGIAVKTIETHRSNLTRKLEVESVAQLVQMVIEHRQFLKKNGPPQGYS